VAYAIFDLIQSEPNQQEHQVAPLVNMEVNIALACLEVGGSLVLKMYTFFNDETIATLETLMRCFDRVCIFKPQCSKPSNSEVIEWKYGCLSTL